MVKLGIAIRMCGSFSGLILPAGDPQAIHSRRDLRRINQVMFQANIMRRLFRRYVAQPPHRIIELGGGDGQLIRGARARKALHRSPANGLNRQESAFVVQHVHCTPLVWLEEIAADDRTINERYLGENRRFGNFAESLVTVHQKLRVGRCNPSPAGVYSRVPLLFCARYRVNGTGRLSLRFATSQHGVTPWKCPFARNLPHRQSTSRAENSLDKHSLVQQPVVVSPAVR